MKVDKRSAAVFFLATALAAVGAGYFFSATTPGTYEDTGARGVVAADRPVMAMLEGLAPGTDISYKIISPEGGNITGSGISSPDGTFELRSDVDAALRGDALTYDVSVSESGSQDPVNLAVTFNSRTGEISMLGKGFDEFSALEVGREKHKRGTRADWAGHYRDTIQWNFGVNRHDPFTLAFFDNHIASDMPANPIILKVLSAPGGGTYNPGGVNGYTTNSNECETVNGVTIPSWCVPASTTAHTFGTYNAGSPHMQRLSHYIMDNYVRALMLMADQLSATMIEHMQVIGSLLDAKQQLETQRTMQQLQAQAHKDYHPSEMMCRVGSFIKSLPRAEEVSMINKEAMNLAIMESYTGLENTAGAEGYAIDIEARIRQFRWVYCDPRDNNDGLAFMCEHDQDGNLANSTVGAAPVTPLPSIGTVYIGGGIGAVTPATSDHDRKNRDIDFGRLVNFPLTLQLDFKDATKTYDEEDILALARNLYWPRALEKAAWISLPKDFENYLSARRVLAIQNVAHNSFVHLAAMKAETDYGLGVDSGWNFMKALMLDFGLSASDIDKLLGAYPSYYAQMEVLTKKMYQNPDFFTNLYDKPVNVERIGASLDAIKIMQQRDMLESRHRTEMLTSMMVEQELTPVAAAIDAAIAKISKKTLQ